MAGAAWLGGIYNGKIYVAGGEFQNDKIMAAFRAFEVCDPATNTWDGSLPRMRIPRHGFAGGVIGNRLHVVAGRHPDGGNRRRGVYRHARRLRFHQN